MNTKERFNFKFIKKENKESFKTFSSLENYNDGEIIFGIDDAGNLTGLDNIDAEYIKIENMINDSLDPIPEITISGEDKEGKTLLFLVLKSAEIHLIIREESRINDRILQPLKLTVLS